MDLSKDPDERPRKLGCVCSLCPPYTETKVPVIGSVGWMLKDGHLNPPQLAV